MVKLKRIGGLYDHKPETRAPLEFAIDIEDPHSEEA